MSNSILFILISFLLIACTEKQNNGDVFTDAERAEELRNRPREISIDKYSLTLDGYVYKNLQPSIGLDDENKLLIASSRLNGPKSILDEIKLSKMYVINEDIIWAKPIDRIIPPTSASATIIESVIDKGPDWEVGQTVVVVLSFNFRNKQYLIASSPLQIEAVY